MGMALLERKDFDPLREEDSLHTPLIMPAGDLGLPGFSHATRLNETVDSF